MLSHFVCGSFQHQEEDDETCKTLPTTPKKSRKSSNPYSDRGRDKFSALVADLEQKRRKIYSQIGSDHISLVRFVYSNNSNDVVPIVVRLKENRQEKSNKTGEGKDGVKDKVNYIRKEESIKKQAMKKSTEERHRSIISWNLNLDKWRRPSYYIPLFMVLILMLLLFVGRTAAVLCTSIGWYLLPTLSSESEQPAKKKVYLRRYSEMKTKNDVHGREKWHKQDRHRKSF